jgi:SseB protein C-terminal domain
MNNRMVEVSVPAGTRMRIGVPAEKPEQVISALVAFFSATDAVTSARLGLMEILLPGGKSDFSYTIGIEATSDRARIHQKTLDILRSVPAGRWPIAVVPSTPQYFTKDAIVFYRRQSSKSNWWSRLFGTK